MSKEELSRANRSVLELLEGLVMNDEISLPFEGEIRLNLGQATKDPQDLLFYYLGQFKITKAYNSSANQFNFVVETLPTRQFGFRFSTDADENWITRKHHTPKLYIAIKPDNFPLKLNPEVRIYPL